MTLPPPTDEVRRLVDLVGPDAALALVERYGGTRYYVLRRPDEALATMVGSRAASALCNLYGGSYLRVPVARHWRVLIYRGRDGLTGAQIARKLGCDERTVWRILDPVARAQLDLFSAD